MRNFHHGKFYKSDFHQRCCIGQFHWWEILGARLPSEMPDRTIPLWIILWPNLRWRDWSIKFQEENFYRLALSYFFRQRRKKRPGHEVGLGKTSSWIISGLSNSINQTQQTTGGCGVWESYNFIRGQFH